MNTHSSTALSVRTIIDEIYSKACPIIARGNRDFHQQIELNGKYYVCRIVDSPQNINCLQFIFQDLRI